jgi:hypothetical protein
MKIGTPEQAIEAVRVQVTAKLGSIWFAVLVLYLACRKQFL